MNLTDSQKLLRSYADRGDEAAFRKLVESYIDLVYSTALRRVNGDTGLAQDVTQAVFTDLARKAPTLRNVEMLGGWLHRHAGFTASNLVRSEHRRQVREQEAAQMNAINDSSDAAWLQLAPVLDDTIEALEPSDRQAVLLRFFEKRDFRAVGEAMGISSDAAQKRVSRAVEKLRALLTERGVTLSLIVLSSLLVGKAVTAAPAGLAANVAKTALAGTAVGGMGLTLLKLAKSFAFKVTVAGIIAALGIWLWQQHGDHSSDGLSLPPPPASTFPHLAQISSTDNLPPAISAAATPTNSVNTSSNVLLLNIVAADSGKPVPDVELDYWLDVKGNFKHKKSLMTTRFGVCPVPVPDGTTELLLVSEKDGFADTLLDWRPDRGEQIPTQYTLQVARAVSISGLVVDPDGNPVAGAHVGFGNYPDTAAQTRPQSDDFSWPYYIETTADGQGRWQITRIGKAALRTVGGGASDPDFVQVETPHGDSTVEQQWLDGRYVFKLGHAVVVRGTVKDPDGNPVTNADVLVGRVGFVNSRETNSDGDGSFSVRGCQPGRTVISATAKGFAATTIKVNLTDDSGPYDLVLQPGKMVKLRVVDENGSPISRAQVYYDSFHNAVYDPNDSEKGTPTQVEFNHKTGKDGRLEWDSAPEGDLYFDISAPGYMRTDSVKLPADGIEHTVTLQRGLTIAGTVVDATTGQPIPRFRIITGWPNIDMANHATNASWSTIDRFWLSFDGGKFQNTYEELVLNGVKDPAFMFKFEAEGYQPFISRVVPASEGFVRLDVALVPGTQTEVTVLSPDNQPAAQTDVGLVSGGSRLRLVPGGFSHMDTPSGGALLMTDDDGHFSLPQDPSIKKVVVAGLQGYAETTPAQLAANPVINLLPWGIVEGTCLSNGQAMAGITLSLQYNWGDYDTLTCDPEAFHAKTDGLGRFIFTRVPPGNRMVSLVSYMDSGSWSDLPLQFVSVESGATTKVQLDCTNQFMPDLPATGADASP